MTDNDPNHATELDRTLDALRQGIAAYESDPRDRERVAAQVVAAASALLASVQIRVGVDDLYPNRISVTVHGLDIYVDRQDSTRYVEFGRDEMPGRLEVDTSMIDLDNALAELAGEDPEPGSFTDPAFEEFIAGSERSNQDGDAEPRHFTEHNNQLGDWCPWSGKPAQADSDSDTACPALCPSSGTEPTEE